MKHDIIDNLNEQLRYKHKQVNELRERLDKMRALTENALNDRDEARHEYVMLKRRVAKEKRNDPRRSN